MDNGGCEQICTDTFLSFNCSCRDGYVLNGDGFTCSGKYSCHSSHVTVNLIVILQILMSVQAKITDVNTHVLIRMDPMSAIVLMATVWMLMAVLVMVYWTLSSFPHIQNNIINSPDVDECLLLNHGCDQECDNTEGSYVCKCNTGYELDHDERSCLGLCVYMYCWLHPVF